MSPNDISSSPPRPIYYPVIESAPSPWTPTDQMQFNLSSVRALKALTDAFLHVEKQLRQIDSNIAEHDHALIIICQDKIEKLNEKKRKKEGEEQRSKLRPRKVIKYK